MQFSGTLFRINDEHRDALKSALHSLGDVNFVAHQTSRDEEQHLVSFQLDRTLSDVEITYLSLRAGIGLKSDTTKPFFLIMSE